MNSGKCRDDVLKISLAVLLHDVGKFTKGYLEESYHWRLREMGDNLLKRGEKGVQRCRQKWTKANF